jgi:hypothetical protein
MGTMAKKKKSLLTRAGNAVVDAAVVVANAANDHVIQPVGQAVGLVKGGKAKKKPAAKKAAVAGKAAKKPATKVAAKKPAAKKR